jgi:hypothetical protein
MDVPLTVGIGRYPPTALDEERVRAPDASALSDPLPTCYPMTPRSVFLAGRLTAI